MNQYDFEPFTPDHVRFIKICRFVGFLVLLGLVFFLIFHFKILLHELFL